MYIDSIRILTLVAGLLGLLFSEPCQVSAQAPSAEQAANTDQASNTEAAEQPEHFKKFEALMTGVKLVGQFTIIGSEKRDHSDEEYTIRSVKKLPQGDYWLFNARIKYGSRDLTLPLPLEVKWAGDTPMITLTELTIPVLGTFSSRVIFYNNKYAGTWTHGEVGGHMFGVLERDEAAQP